MLIKNVDPITFEVLSHRLHQITREMGITLERTGGTVTTTQQHDYNASLYRAEGEIMAAGETYGHHVVCAGFAVRRILERFGKDEICPDDVFRSEEHTSELQSLRHLVCRLLLEKK